jgi:putative ABC transport system permease protein
MKITALLAQSFRSIWNNKVRSSLTVLGIVIGIAAVIALVGLGNGLQASVTDKIGGLGITKVTVRSQTPGALTAERQRGPGGGKGGFVFGGGNVETLTKADYQTVKNTADIKAASPEGSTQTDVALTANADTASAYQLYGVDSDYFDIQDYKVGSGSLLTGAQVDSSEAVAVLSHQAAEQLFPSIDNPVGQKVYIKDTEFTVTGVLAEPEQQAAGGPIMTSGGAGGIYTGYNKWQEVTGKEKFSSIVADASSEEAVEKAADAIKTSLLSAHGITDENKSDVAINTNKSLLDTASDVTGSFTTTLAGIAAISLVVGGIGIMNIMLVTVTERTREIGLRRAVGAKTRHILLQFLLESVMLTMIGGILGLIAGIGFSQYAGQLLAAAPGMGDGVQAVIDGGTVLMAVGVSALIGIVFGLFPAIKATRLDPVEALRYE